MVVEPRKSISEKKRAKEIAERLKLSTTDNVEVIYVNRNDRLRDDIIWTDILANI